MSVRIKKELPGPVVGTEKNERVEAAKKWLTDDGQYATMDHPKMQQTLGMRVQKKDNDGNIVSDKTYEGAHESPYKPGVMVEKDELESNRKKKALNHIIGAK